MWRELVPDRAAVDVDGPGRRVEDLDPFAEPASTGVAGLIINSVRKSLQLLRQTVTLTNSTVSNNYAVKGGGIFTIFQRNVDEQHGVG